MVRRSTPQCRRQSPEILSSEVAPECFFDNIVQSSAASRRFSVRRVGDCLIDPHLQRRLRHGLYGTSIGRRITERSPAEGARVDAEFAVAASALLDEAVTADHDCGGRDGREAADRP